MAEQKVMTDNIEMEVSGDKLFITIDLSKDYGPSASGKTTVIASSKGNQPLPEPFEEMKIGLNIYRKD